MHQRNGLRGLALAYLFFFCVGGGMLSEAADAPAKTPRKVLIVMSYDEAYAWSQELRAGLEAALPPDWERKYTYLDTKRNPADGARKAQEVAALYHEFQPDGVIACDDNAQTMFVIPYLKDKVTTPVIFCGVNAAPEAYGYPASNVTGVLERPFFQETVAFLKQLDPRLKTIAHIMRGDETGRAYAQLARQDYPNYMLKPVAFELPETFEEALASTRRLKSEADALYIMTVSGLPDADGKPLSDEFVVRALIKEFGKPTCTDLNSYVNYGVLFAAAQMGCVQGKQAVNMLISALEGTLIEALPIMRSFEGRRMLNLNALQTLGLKPNLQSLAGVELVTHPQ